MDAIAIQYIITVSNGSKIVFDLKLGANDLKIIADIQEDIPAWTDLHFHQCDNCTLTSPPHEKCPLAAHICAVVKRCENLLSYSKVHLAVITSERTVCQDTTAQRAISSLIGLISASSGCPHTSFFRPMARFHLPLASEAETIYRATSMYLLAQYFLKKGGIKPDIELNRLKEIYQNITVVNKHIARRVQTASSTDSAVNAIILLDLLAKALPYALDESLEEIRYLFLPFYIDT